LTGCVDDYAHPARTPGGIFFLKRSSVHVLPVCENQLPSC